MPSSYQFTDRTEDLFGRQADIDYLLDRVQNTGLTAICGRPQMGKTWLLQQVGYLLDQQGVLVGYHDLTSSADDHLLRAVEDLYKRWLSGASMMEQAASIFRRHKGHLITGAGKMIGAIFKEAAGAVPGGKAVGAAVEETFKALDSAHKDLMAGGLELPALDYDSARALTQIVHDESGYKKIVLILDAWEKNANVEKAYNTLEAFLKRHEDWCSCHILLGIRHPDLMLAGAKRASEFAEDLAKLMPAKLYRLEAMDLSDQAEETRMLHRLDVIAPATAKIKAKTLVSLVKGFPGVLYRIRGTRDKSKLGEEQDLRKLAQDAQNYRYREFEELLPALKGDHLTMALRVALFHQLTEQGWPEFREVLCVGIDKLCWEDLRGSVFEDAKFPTYGHSTRHGSAFGYFSQMRCDRSKAELKKIVCELASRVQYIDYRDKNFASALRDLIKKVKSLDLDEFYATLCEAAASLFRGADLQDLRGIENALLEAQERCPRATFLLLSSLLILGANKGMADESEVAIEYFNALLNSPGAPEDLIIKAQLLRAIIQGKTKDYIGSIKHANAVIEHTDAPSDIVAKALLVRGSSMARMSNYKDGIDDFTKVIRQEDVPAYLVAHALNYRAHFKGKSNNERGAIDDYTKLIELEGAPFDMINLASINIVLIYLNQGRISPAIGFLVDAISSGSVADGGFGMIDLFENKVDDLKTIVDDKEARDIERGGALAFLEANIEEDADDYVQSWLKNEEFVEAAKVYLSLMQTWREHSAKIIDSETST